MTAVAALEMDFAGPTIDFRLAQRFAESHAQMKLRQQGCDVRVTGYIKKFARRQRLFLTHNHPTNVVFFEMLKQLAVLTGLPVALPAGARKTLDQLTRTNCPVSPYDIKTMGYPFEPDPDWYERGSALILTIAAHWRPVAASATTPVAAPVPIGVGAAA